MCRLPLNSSASRILFCLAAVLFTASPLWPAPAAKTEASAFLQSYATTAVRWSPWGEAAFARAKQEKKPLYVAIGSFTSELSRAMNRQTFSNADTAAFLNEHFICILVDAKEQPELTALYQNYIETVKQLHGLPLNLWLTPDLKPFDGANYLPPTEEWGKEGFLTVARRAAAGWTADSAAQQAKAKEAANTVIAAQKGPPPTPATDAAITEALGSAVEAWRGKYDTVHGGFSEAPKYAEPELIRFLLSDPSTREMAVTTLNHLLQGGVHDPLDGGVFRYAVDADWRLPYFQKTLADQARFTLMLLDAAGVTGDATFAQAARETLDFALSRLAMGNGEFYSAEDATTDSVMAGYFWTAAEIHDLLGETNAAEFSKVYGITTAGNVGPDAFPGQTMVGKNILAGAGVSSSPTLAASRKNLLQHRDQRAMPSRDGGATSSAHGLLLTALSRASRELKEPRFAEAAAAQFKFIQSKLHNPAGEWQHLAYQPGLASPEDCAFLAQGLLEFSAATKNPAAEKLALELVTTAVKIFYSAPVGRILAVRDNPPAELWARVRPPQPIAGEAPSAESTLLEIVSSNPAAATAAGDVSKSLVAAVAEEVRNAAEAPRGDLLLALSAARPKK
jgi:uncharacterized protein YyaL (SSP411 family)